MAFSATVIPVMIASPGDVSQERSVIRSVIHDWNDVNGKYSKVVLSPVGWDSHSSPELGARPQELINLRVLKDCDLLVGVFWTRLGTPTGESRSGTVEEIERHVAAGKPAMIYFSSQPVELDSVDPLQYAELKKFKRELLSKGLVESYSTVAEFREKFSKQLQITLNENEYLRSLMRIENSSPGPEVIVFPPEPEPSVDAKILLQAAAQEDSGTILKLAYISGRVIQAGTQSFGEENSREAARWESALNELVNLDLVVERGFKGEVFELTHKGWTVAQSL